MKSQAKFKANRVLYIYMKLLQGEVLYQKSLAREFHVTIRTIQRDISVLRCVLAEQRMGQEIINDSNGSRLQHEPTELVGNREILMVGKILMESSSIQKDEILSILDKLIARCVPTWNQKAISELLEKAGHP